jgi:hypothetical protein
MAGVKRKLDEVPGQEEEEEVEREEEEDSSNTAMVRVAGSATARKRRKLEFQDVTVFHFNRRQGFVCVPSQVRYYDTLTSTH